VVPARAIQAQGILTFTKPVSYFAQTGKVFLNKKECFAESAFHYICSLILNAFEKSQFGFNFFALAGCSDEGNQ